MALPESPMPEWLTWFLESAPTSLCSTPWYLRVPKVAVIGVRVGGAMAASASPALAMPLSIESMESMESMESEELAVLR